MHSYRPAPVLEALGVCSEDEQLYRALLARPECTTIDLSHDTGWAATRVGRHLRSLLSLGLASRTPGRPARYVPAVPEAAVELLALRKQAAIVEARVGASVLTAEFRARHDAFTVVRGAEAIAQRFYQAQQCAQDEVLVLDRPPYAVVPIEPRRAHGVSYRTIYDMASLSEPTDLVAARSAGCRILRDVPLKLVVVDRRTGLLPTSPDVVVELGPSSLLDGLLRLFELLWKQASPLAPSPAEGPLSFEDQQLLSLAAAGLTDQAIARRLGVAQRTVERRMQRILKSLDATTRFQAGLRAGQRGLLV
ncbi:helix-turn-helix domain-containing protein [Kribbella sp. NPDC050281]|uniref:helix-turn-helix transcriptional regulator n=1 Tax=Kribbella sp. NPDC050281 TaxID=3155515 RepID=UPI00340E0F21